MKYNTRFNPTVSGDSLHLGHIYLAIVNATEAHNSGGKFIVRIDDTQKEWIYKLGGQQKVAIYAERYIDQIREFVEIDEISYHSRLPFRRQIAESDTNIPDFILNRPIWRHDQYPDWIESPEMVMYPYTPVYTLEKVLWDYYEEINWLIRGEDLVTEFSLYTYFTDLIGLSRIKHTYIPRLRDEECKELTPLSKSVGEYKFSDQIKILGKEGILELLRKSCLKDVDKEFTVDNIKCRPTIIGFKE